MYLLLGQIITLITFPGVVIHELSHQLFCRFLTVEVEEVCYFRIGSPAGYVIHEPTKKWIHTVAIAAGPFFINSLIASILAFPVALKIEFGNTSDILLLWLAISIGMHAIPSTGDAQSMWRAVSGNRASLGAKLFVKKSFSKISTPSKPAFAIAIIFSFNVPFIETVAMEVFI